MACGAIILLLVGALIVLAVAIAVPIVVCCLGGGTLSGLGILLAHFFPSLSEIETPLFFLGFGATLSTLAWLGITKRRKILKFILEKVGEKPPDDYIPLPGAVSTRRRGFVEVNELK